MLRKLLDDLVNLGWAHLLCQQSKEGKMQIADRFYTSGKPNAFCERVVLIAAV
jgi:hypothetical protein